MPNQNYRLCHSRGRRWRCSSKRSALRCYVSRRSSCWESNVHQVTWIVGIWKGHQVPRPCRECKRQNPALDLLHGEVLCVGMDPCFPVSGRPELRGSDPNRGERWERGAVAWANFSFQQSLENSISLKDLWKEHKGKNNWVVKYVQV